MNKQPPSCACTTVEICIKLSIVDASPGMYVPTLTVPDILGFQQNGVLRGNWQK